MAQTNNQMRQNNPSSQRYYVYGTGEPYTGLTVNVGGYLYTTVGGALEGNSLQVVLSLSNPNKVVDNSIIETFKATSNPRYRRSDNNRLIPIGTKLHRHGDGTVMTKHSMNSNNNSIVVNVVNQPQNPISSSPTLNIYDKIINEGGLLSDGTTAGCDPSCGWDEYCSCGYFSGCKCKPLTKPQGQGMGPY